jgi:photosystem II stability/assembly factor-like uncharacterized protein
MNGSTHTSGTARGKIRPSRWIYVVAIGLAAAAHADGAPLAEVQQVTCGSAGVTSSVLPSSGPGIQLWPESLGGTAAESRVGRNPIDWEQMTVPGGIYIRAISMASPQVGFAAGELGKVLRTTDGGDTWQYVLDQGFPYYYYGVHALNESNVIISGFQNQSGEGIIRWSEDGGETWAPVIALPCPAAVKWLAHVHFIDDNRGIVEAAWAGGVHRTTTGGRTAADWTYVEPSGSWFYGTFTYLYDGRVWLAGIDVVHSPDHGVNWTMLPSTNAVFDGPIAVRTSDIGFIGGGQISTPVSGWVYGTTDGGQSWTPAPILTTPYPIRGLMLLNDRRGWAVGGNVYTTVGGIWGTEDGGSTWVLEEDTSNEMNDLDWVRVDADYVDVYVAGYISQIFRARIASPAGDVDGDGDVDLADLAALLSAYGTCAGDPVYNPAADFDSSGCIDLADLAVLLSHYGISGA